MSALAASPEVAESDPWHAGRWDADSENGGPSQPDMVPGGAGEENTEDEELTLKHVMEAIHHCQSTLTTQIESVQLDFSIVKHNVQLTTTEQCISDIEDTVHPISANLGLQQEDSKERTVKLGHLEDRMRRNNLRFIGFPEGTKGKDPELLLRKMAEITSGVRDFVLLVCN